MSEMATPNAAGGALPIKFQEHLQLQNADINVANIGFSTLTMEFLLRKVERSFRDLNIEITTMADFKLNSLRYSSRLTPTCS